ncbi:MAG: bifunctional indole-3-glycerol phosphate synthase/phosphoribosylanthranilate isomerase [Spirochaetales bacterium]|nr:bifunctional indole-3-glycerol phosphate synthase/phosphoribosylanthranilate isomerase [Spirochaetales bacterium]
MGDLKEEPGTAGKNRLPGETILHEIVRVRRERIKKLGHCEGADVPAEREAAPPRPFGVDPFLICEIKRRSPSKGNINNSLDPLEQAKIYTERGASHISILTESEYFGGSLDDLMAVRKAFPEARILRKDFLLDLEDVEVAYRAGADAFLLIASVLDYETIRAMYERGVALGMTPLVELHSAEEAEMVRPFAPKLTGVNCRDLKTFTIDPLGPVKLKSRIDWDCQVVYESGIKSPGDARFALGCGLDGLLVGEGVVRDKELAAGLIAEFAAREEHRDTYAFWRKLYRNYNYDRPLVKICGITRVEDAKKAVELGADALGFILAESPRKIDPKRLEEFRKIDAVKIAVVIFPEDEAERAALEATLRDLLGRGWIDAVQFHGTEGPELVETFPGYKALTVKSAEDLEGKGAYRPRPVLTDAFHRDRSGKKTEVLEPEVIEAARKQGNLWLAGGLNPDNLEGILKEYRPELIDMASGVEASPGVKDHGKLARIFEIVKKA